MNAAIIGGGYAGMAAAVTLAARGIPVTVFESAKQLGGRARSVRHNATLLDNGQHILLGCYHETLRLIEQVGGNIEQDFLRLPLQLTLHNRFELKSVDLPAPYHLLGGLLMAKGLSISQRLAAVRFMLSMRRINFRLPSATSGESAGKVSGYLGPLSQTLNRLRSMKQTGFLGMTALELLRIHGQEDELLHLLWEPICIAALNTPAHKASAQVMLNVLRDSLNSVRSDSDMLLPRLDFSALFPERAAEFVKTRGGEVHIACGVEAIAVHGEEIELTSVNGAQRFNHVICAASPVAASRLFRAVPQLVHSANQIAAIPLQPIYTVYLQYPQQVALQQPMLGLHHCITQWLFDRGQISGQPGLLAAVISAEGLHQEWDHEVLVQKVVQELSGQLGLAEVPRWSKVIAEKRATFSCEPKLPRPPHLTPLPCLLLAGDYTAGDYPSTLEGAVRSGIRCADEIRPA